MRTEVDEVKMKLALKDDEIRELKGKKTGALDQIREIVGNLGDVLNKAQLFDKYVNKEVVITMPKVIAILVGFHKMMEVVLGEIRKLVPGSVRELSWLPLPPPKDTPQKEKPLEEMKTPLPQRPGKEAVAEVSREAPPAEFPATMTAAAPEVTPAPNTKKTESVELLCGN